MPSFIQQPTKTFLKLYVWVNLLGFGLVGEGRAQDGENV